MRRRERLLERIEVAQKELEALDAFPLEDDFADGTVLWFERTFHGSSTYTYVALKAAGFWYLTGARSRNTIGWGTLVDEYLASGCDEVWVASTWDRLVPPA